MDSRKLYLGTAKMNKPITQVAKDMLARMQPGHKCDTCPHYFGSEEMAGLCEAVGEAEEILNLIGSFDLPKTIAGNAEAKVWLAKYALEQGEG